METKGVLPKVSKDVKGEGDIMMDEEEIVVEETVKDNIKKDFFSKVSK
nr:1527_t:CDS:2 [Entrophospora candida]